MIESPSIQILHAGSELRLLRGAAFKVRPYTQDGIVYDSVIIDNEYRLPDQFLPSDVIVDIGAHVGFFSLACLARGARTIEAYEPDRDNFDLLRQNVGHRGVKVFNKAVWRSDYNEELRLKTMGHKFTAMSIVISGNGYPVDSISLDEILKKHEKVKLLKIDCEGSEYAILMTASMELLRRCEYICGEMHTAFGRTVVPYHWNADSLTRRMEQAGFSVEQRLSDSAPRMVRNFWAKRKECQCHSTTLPSRVSHTRRKKPAPSRNGSSLPYSK